MGRHLSGKRVAIVATDGIEQAALDEPLRTMKRQGAQVDIVAPQYGLAQVCESTDLDHPLYETRADNYDAIVLPGASGDREPLRAVESAAGFVRDFFAARKPRAVVCHGPWTLIEAGMIGDEPIAREPAPPRWIDNPVVLDGGVVSPRMPAELPAFRGSLVAERRDCRRKAS